MSVSGVNSTINANPQVQQQKSKSNATVPISNTVGGAIAGAGLAAVDGYYSAKSSMKNTLGDINSKKLTMEFCEEYLKKPAIPADAKKSYENLIKESKQSLEKLNAELLKYKKAVKPMGILKSVAKAPLTYILAATGLVVGLCVNHKNKSAEQ